MSAHSKAKDPPAIRMVQLIRRFGLMGLVCVDNVSYRSYN